MSDPPKADTLCELCSLLSFDDAAIGGEEREFPHGFMRLSFPGSRITFPKSRLSFPESNIELRPSDWQQRQDFYRTPPDYRLVRLQWKLDDVLPDMPYLSRSSQLGCAFCQALRRSLQETFVSQAKYSHITAGPLNLQAYLAVFDEGIEGMMVEASCGPDAIQTIFPIEATSDCAAWLGVEDARDASYLDPTNICEMRRSLDDCIESCSHNTQSSFVPTRLIDVGHDASDVPRLVLPSEIRKSKQIKYAALSYCWGDEKDAESQFKTEKASLEDRYVSLPSDLMTATTNDAIAVTRAIGLRYIWIDALCIVQDDQSDWLRESSQMDLVYRHAFVTFCSLNSDSCHESFLNRAPVVKVPFHSMIQKAIKGAFFIVLRPRTGIYIDRTAYTWDDALSKWGKRCWTFQEGEMSTRLLLFGSLRMHFYCTSNQGPGGERARGGRLTLGVSDKITRFNDNIISASEVYEYWDLLVHNYGDRSVTFEKDRLPAIAGLARMIGETLEDRYLAGLWRGDLLRGLAWYSRSDTQSRGLEAHIRSIRERNYVAPSWSWAASPGVAIMRYRGKCLVEESAILHATTGTGLGDPYGQVSGGFIQIFGKLVPMPQWLLTDRGTGWSNSWSHSMEDESSFICIMTDWLHKDKERGAENLVLMLLHRIELKDDTQAPWLRALLLHPAGRPHDYYRVGLVHSEGHDAYRKMRAWFGESQGEVIYLF